VPERPSARPLLEANNASTPAFLPVSILDAGPAGELEIELANACIVVSVAQRPTRTIIVAT
jgi:hypothetical protein